MGYYMGDYYAGSRGDPGIGSFLSGLASSALSFIPGVGGIASKGLSSLVTGATKGRGIIKSVGGAVMRHPAISAAGAVGVIGAGAAAGHVLMGGHRKCRKTHINKHGKEVCNRRMNPCNPRALRRAIRRTHGFAKLAMRTIHLVHPKKKVRFGGYKKRKSHK
jgi:hypothetical protein